MNDLYDALMQMASGASRPLNRQLFDAYDAYRNWGAQNKRAMPPWLNRSMDVMDWAAAMPGAGLVLPGSFGGPLKSAYKAPESMTQLLAERPDLLSWYKSAENATLKEDILDFLLNNYVKQAKP